MSEIPASPTSRPTEGPAALKPQNARDAVIFLFILGVALAGIGAWIYFAHQLSASPGVPDGLTGTPTVELHGSLTAMRWGEAIAGVGSALWLIASIAAGVALGLRMDREQSVKPEATTYVPKSNPWADGAQI